MKKNKIIRFRVIAFMLTFLMLIPFAHKNKNGIFTKMETLYHKYFTEDNSDTIIDDLETEIIVEEVIEKPLPIENNIEESIIKNEEETEIIVEEVIENPLPIENKIEEPIINNEEETLIDNEIEPETILIDNTPEEVIDVVETPIVIEEEVTEEAIIDNDEVEHETKKVAFTFDDGPSKYTKELLEILKENNAEATFFVLGAGIKKYSNTIIDMKDNGHQIESHGVSHTSFTKLTNEELIKELETTKSLLAKYEITQTLVRPPYGSTNDRVKENVDYPLIMWSVDTRDWEHRDSEKSLQIIIENIEDGSIILMHDIHKTTIEAIRMVLPILKEQGYEFVTIEELFEDKELEDGKTYYKKK